MGNAYEDSVWFIPATEVTIKKAEPLGKGGFGEVYSGYYGTIPVAIKTITGLDNPKAVQMAKSEATLWHTLKHPNITLLYGVSVDEHGNPTLIVERAETSLHSRLYCANGEEPVSKEVKMRWILQIAQAFKYLHAQKNPVIHADLNPRNVLLGYDGVVKITDFGLSRCLVASHSFSRQSHGTMRYSPPESFAQEYVAHPAYDVFSYAMTVYEILSGFQPFDDAYFVNRIPAWVQDGERPESQPDQIPGDSWEWSLIQACWDQDPIKRPSFEEIVKTILEHSDSPSIGPRSSSLSESIPAPPNVTARTSPVSKDKTDTPIVETSTLSEGSEDDPAEQVRLGLMYKHGTKVPQDYSKAVQLLSKAANQGNAKAQYNLGVMYYYGIGVNKSYPKAVELYTLAANQGDADAQTALGYSYQYGQGVVKDYTKAVEWYTLAANQGHANGQFKLGRMYRDGEGVACNNPKAVELFTLAANQGDVYAQTELGTMYRDG
ncbi:kinase-like domain-containing protein [Obelidium mucronatum]|nr:kinase-like domain-containing protein [Obelidium mucronatum]